MLTANERGSRSASDHFDPPPSLLWCRSSWTVLFLHFNGNYNWFTPTKYMRHAPEVPALHRSVLKQLFFKKKVPRKRRHKTAKFALRCHLNSPKWGLKNRHHSSLRHATMSKTVVTKTTAERKSPCLFSNTVVTMLLSKAR